MKIRAVLLLMTLLTLFAAGAQESSTKIAPSPAHAAGQSNYQINANLVLLDVVVTDRNGAIVDNLSKEDFRIYEDDALQTVRSFEHYRPIASQPRIHSTAELDRVAPDAPVSIMVLDEMTTSFEDRAFARYSLKTYLAGQGAILWQPTMLVVAGRQHFRVLCDYTTSKDDVLRSLDRYHPANDAWQRYSAGAKAKGYTAAFAWLMEVAEATAGHRGHKNMIWVGRGFPDLDDPVFTARGTLNVLTSEESRQLNSAFAICTNALRDARVTLYSVDPVGVSMDRTAFGGQPEFESIALLTGGRAFHGRNDVDQLIEKSAEYGANFYSLSFVPSSTGVSPKDFRKIRVVMNDPALRAVTREGYFVRNPPSVVAGNNSIRPSDGALRDFVLAGQSKMVYDTVPLRVLRDSGNPTPLRITLRTSDLAWRRTAAHILSADATVLIESFDRKDRLIDYDSVIHTLNRAAKSSEELPATSTVTMSANVPTEPNVKRLRIVVLVNATGKIGAENLSFEK